jgi:hypothetical protein
MQSNADQFTTANGRVQMDVWWGTIGSQLIAEAVRANNAGVR